MTPFNTGYLSEDGTFIDKIEYVPYFEIDENEKRKILLEENSNNNN